LRTGGGFALPRLFPYSADPIVFPPGTEKFPYIFGDINLLIVSRHLKGEVEEIVERLRLPKKLQLIIRDPVAYAEMERRDPGFCAEVDRGITVWESGK
jgi:hypothetical protein